MFNSLLMSAVWTGMKTAYAYGARKLIKEAIDDPNSEWDETALSFLDRVFDYSSGKKKKD